jgi:hypothetical protein
VNFVPMVEELGLNSVQRALVVGLVIGRMAAPGSERSTDQWLCERSGLGELLEVDYAALPPIRLYRTSDLLQRHQAALEKHLFSEVSNVFGLSTTVTLYDLTNTYFAGEAADIPKAKRGHSKEKRTDCPLLTLGLVLDGRGPSTGSGQASCAVPGYLKAMPWRVGPWPGGCRGWGRRRGH